MDTAVMTRELVLTQGQTVYIMNIVLYLSSDLEAFLYII